MKLVSILGTALLAWNFSASALETPRGRETFGPRTTVASIAPPAKTILIVWTYPTGLQTPDMIFKLYHSTNLTAPFNKWILMTNVPGTARSVRIGTDKARDFFILTASNRLGETGYATK